MLRTQAAVEVICRCFIPDTILWMNHSLLSLSLSLSLSRTAFRIVILLYYCHWSSSCNKYLLCVCVCALRVCLWFFLMSVWSSFNPISEVDFATLLSSCWNSRVDSSFSRACLLAFFF
jgi:hypothetical protein